MSDPPLKKEEADEPRMIPHREPAEGIAMLEAAQPGKTSRFKRALSILGPGFITGASDDDPSGIGTYSSVGAAFGYRMLWMAPLSFPMMWAVQYICAKIGMVTGQGLAGVLRTHYSRKVLIPAISLLVIANTINAGVDIGAIAAGINLIVPVSIEVMIIPITMVILLIQILGSYRMIAQVFKWLALALVAYIGAGFFANPDFPAVLRGTFIPSIDVNRTFLFAIVAILGTTISPYLFFWQASEEVEEEVSAGRTELAQREGATTKELRYAGIDVGIGMLFSNVVMYFIILTTAATLHTEGITNVSSAAEAAIALRPIAGRGAELLLAVGMIGTGFLAVPILTGSGAYAMAEAFGWRYGFDEHPRGARSFYIVIVASTLIGMLINYIGINPIQALYWTAVINGLLAPPLLVLIMLISNKASLMGDRKNGKCLNLLGWGTTALMSIAGLALIWTWL